MKLRGTGRCIMGKRLFLLALLLGMLIFFIGVNSAGAAPPTEQRITQSILVNGQQVQGITVVQNGVVQNYACPSPQQYVTTDQSSGGWTCFDETTGTWLLHALPPQSADTYNQPSVVYDSGSTVYSYSPYAYSY